MSESGQTKGPLFVDTSQEQIIVTLMQDTYYQTTAGGSVTAMLTPGTVGRYMIPFQLPLSLPSSTNYEVKHAWVYCPFGPIGSCAPLSGGLQSFNNPGPFNIHVVSP